MGLDSPKSQDRTVSLYTMLEFVPHLLVCAVLCRHGVRNSLLLAPMPTASTAQILGNNESFEPYTSNIYTRRVLSGEFQVCMGMGLLCKHV